MWFGQLFLRVFLQSFVQFLSCFVTKVELLRLVEEEFELGSVGTCLGDADQYFVDVESHDRLARILFVYFENVFINFLSFCW